MAVNDAGQVTGTAPTSLSGVGNAFRYSGGVLTPLCYISCVASSEGVSINSAGDVAFTGYNLATGERQAMVFRANAGITETLGNLWPAGTINTFGQALQINDAGTVLAASSNGTSFRAFLHQGGIATNLGDFGGPQTFARDMNNSGQVVGHADSTAIGGGRAFLYSAGILSDIGTLGGNGADAFAINDLGQIVGSSYVYGDYAYYAFLYQNGSMTNLGTLGGYLSTAVDINNFGQVLVQGASDIFHSDNDYAVYESGSLTNLDTLVAGLGIVDVNTAILGEGYIAGMGTDAAGQTRSFLLRSSSVTGTVGEPASVGLIVAGLGLAGLARRKKRRV